MRTPDRGVLEELPLLNVLPPDARTRVIQRFVPASFPFGSVIAAQGARPDAFYVLVSGRARLVRETAATGEIALTVLRAGDSFGDVELLDDVPRLSTIRASSDMVALRLGSLHKFVPANWKTLLSATGAANTSSIVNSISAQLSR